MSSTRRKGWQLLVIPDSESSIKQFRLPRGIVLAVVGLFGALIIYSIVETFMFWSVAGRAGQVEPLKAKVRELESSNGELKRMGKDLVKLQNFEKQLKHVLSGYSGDSLTNTPLTTMGRIDPSAIIKAEKSLDEDTPAENTVMPDKPSPGSNPYTATDLPTQAPLRGYITRTFSLPGPAHAVSHQGIDIAAKQGTPVLAAADGLVIFADWTYDYGNLVVLQHRSGFTSFYGHNQVMFVKPGERVRQGEPVASLGNSGKSTAPHLHFEVWSDGNPIDPMTLFKTNP